MCAESPGNRQTAAGLLTAGPTRSLAARGKRRASEGHCGGPSRRLDPSPGLAAGPGRAPPLPRTRLRTPPGAPVGQRSQGSSLLPRPALPRLGPRPDPGPAAHPPETDHSPARRPQPPPPPLALPQPRCGPTGGCTRSAGAAVRGGTGGRAPTLLSASSGRHEPQGGASQPHHAAARYRIEGRGRPERDNRAVVVAAAGGERLRLALTPPRTAAV